MMSQHKISTFFALLATLLWAGCDSYPEVAKDSAEPDTAEPSAGDQEWFRDYDHDGYGDLSISVVAREQPASYVADSNDCDDSDPGIHPGADEICNGLDDDCDTEVDEDPVDGGTFYADLDGDGAGDPQSSLVACSMEPGMADNDYDCDDSDPDEPVVADPASGSTMGTGRLDSPLDSLQAAIHQASACVIAMDGTYAESIDLNGKSLELRGVDGSSRTIIDPALETCTTENPEDCAAVITIASGSGSTPHIHGFTIRGGTGAMDMASTITDCADSSASHSGNNTCSITVYSFRGGGIFVDGDDPILEDLVIAANLLPPFSQEITGSYQQTWYYSFGGGLYVDAGTVQMSGVEFLQNYADQGGGIALRNGAVVAFDQGIIHQNSATDGGGIAVDSASFSMANAIVACNGAATDGGGIFAQGTSNLDLENTVFYQNQSSEAEGQRGSQLYAASGSLLAIRNSIATGDTLTTLLYAADPGQLTYNDVFSSADPPSTYGGALEPGLGSIQADPLFVDPSCSTFEEPEAFFLQPSSPAIDAGDPAPAYVDTDSSRNDMGAFGGPGGDW